jgi:F-type H+-transporting ATPase subunit b
LSPRKRVSALFALVLFLSAFGLGMAAEEGAAGSSGAKDFVGKVVNFVLLFGGLAYLLRKPLAKFVADKAELIRSGLKKAEAAAEEARAKLQGIEARAASLASEIEAMRQKAEADGRAEKERILEAARREAARLKEFSEQEIEAEVRAGVRRLKEYATDKALALALDRVRGRLDPEAQGRLVDASIDKLAKVHEERHPGPTVRPRTH